jgi:hypothetical protein
MPSSVVSTYCRPSRSGSVYLSEYLDFQRLPLSLLPVYIRSTTHTHLSRRAPTSYGQSLALIWPSRYMTMDALLSLFCFPAILATGLCCFLTHLSILLVYRLWLSPIAAFPGPLLARSTYWYEFYYDWIKCGQYYLRIEEMHREYGRVLHTIFSCSGPHRSMYIQAQSFESRPRNSTSATAFIITIFL